MRTAVAASSTPLHRGAADIGVAAVDADAGIVGDQIAEPAQEGRRRDGEPAIEQGLVDADIAADALLRLQRRGHAALQVQRLLIEGRPLGAGAEAGAQLGLARRDLIGRGEAAGEEAVGALLAVIAPAEGQEEMVDGRDLVAGKQGIAGRRLIEAGRAPQIDRRVLRLLQLQPCAGKQLPQGPGAHACLVFRAGGMRSVFVDRRRTGLVVAAMIDRREGGERLIDTPVGAVEGKPAVSRHQRVLRRVALIGGVDAPARRAVIIGGAGGAGDAEFEAWARGRRVAAADRAAPLVEAVGLVVVAIADPRKAAGGDVLAAHQHAEIALGEAARQAFDMGAVAAALDGRGEPRFAMRLAGDDVDHAAHGVGAVDRALRPAQDLDALDIVERDGREIEFAADGRRIVDAHAVDEHQRMAGVAAPQAHGGGSAGAARLGHGHPRHRPQHLGDRGRRRLLDLIARDDRDGTARLTDRDRQVIGRDHDRGNLGQGRRSRRGEQERCGAEAPGRWSHIEVPRLDFFARTGSSAMPCITRRSGFPAGPPRGKRAPSAARRSRP